jgi:serine/threonine protein kinase
VAGYTEVRLLGEGGFGKVVLATHDASGTAVAIKYLHPDLLRDQGHVAMFQAEARTLASLDSPHVVRLYEYVEGPAGAAIVMELVEGVTLASILERGQDHAAGGARRAVRLAARAGGGARPGRGAPRLQAGQRAH